MGDHSISHGRRARKAHASQNIPHDHSSDEQGVDGYRVNFQDAYIDDIDEGAFDIQGHSNRVSSNEDFEIEQVYMKPYYADDDIDEDYGEEYYVDTPNPQVDDSDDYGDTTDTRIGTPDAPLAFTRRRDESESNRRVGGQATGRTGYFDHRGSRKKPKDPRQSMGRRKYIYLAIIAAVAVVLVVGVVKIVGSLGSDTESIEPGTEVTVNIPNGSSTSVIANILEDQGVIESANSFKSYVTAQDEESALKPGSYSMTTGMDNESVLALLVKGPNGITVTIPEGYTIQQTADAVSEATGISSSEFVTLCGNAGEYAAEYPFLTGAYNNSLEGYLFPKTYSIQAGATADDVIRMMLGQFATETAELDMSYPESKGLSASDVVTMASLIEEEAFFDEDRTHIAGILYNRLDAGMRLQLDVTVSYALGGKSTDLTYDDLEVDSPYNTYKINGLPPGPICSPGMASLQAVCSPLQTEDLYFILTDQYSWFYTNDEDFQAGKQAYKAQ